MSLSASSPRRRSSRAWLAGVLLAAGGDAAASYGFFDQGLVQTPVVRTDYATADAGTAAAPLAISDCHFGQNPCPLLHSVFSQSNYWSLNLPDGCPPGSCPNYWLLTNNDENADSSSNSGPPDASLPHAWPGNGIMGFNVLHGDDNFPGDTYWRARTDLNRGRRPPNANALDFRPCDHSCASRPPPSPSWPSWAATRAP